MPGSKQGSPGFPPRLPGLDPAAPHGRGGARGRRDHGPPKHAPGTVDDVRVGHAVAVAIEATVVHDDVLVAHENVRPRGHVEREAEITGVALQAVSDERVAAGESREEARAAGPGHAVVAEDVVGHRNRYERRPRGEP